MAFHAAGGKNRLHVAGEIDWLLRPAVDQWTLGEGCGCRAGDDQKQGKDNSHE
jgi:hypothetical protein